MSRVALGAVNVEAADPQALAAFWGAVTGAVPTDYDGFVFLPAVEPGGFAMFFQALNGSRPDRQAMHLDLTVSWGTRQAEVDRLLARGATFRWDILEEFAHVRWTTLADPEGNLFCVAEHPPS